MILLWGLPGDGPMARVYDCLHRFGQHTTFLDQRLITDAAVEMAFDVRAAGVVRTDDHPCVDLGTVTAAYVRSYDPRQLPEVVRAGPESDTWKRATSVEDILGSWADVTEALVINRPRAMIPNASKPFQARQLRSLGFCVPETLITTDPDAVLDFRRRYRRVIYKSISSVRSIVSELTDDHLSRLADVCSCPTQFQEFVPGIDYRIHVVGCEIFPAEIVSEASDYRYAARQGFSSAIRATTIPEELASRCVAASRAMGLIVSGIDLRRTPDGEWYCFEVNPSPAFSFYQAATGQPIDESIARVLMRGQA